MNNCASRVNAIRVASAPHHDLGSVSREWRRACSAKGTAWLRSSNRNSSQAVTSTKTPPTTNPAGEMTQRAPPRLLSSHCTNEIHSVATTMYAIVQRNELCDIRLGRRAMRVTALGKFASRANVAGFSSGRTAQVSRPNWGMRHVPAGPGATVARPCPA